MNCMKKIFITAICVFFFKMMCWSQWGDVNEPIAITGSITWNCVVNKAGYANAPTIIFIPGSGEIGGTNGFDTTKVYVNGPNRMMKEGWKGYVNGERWNVITLQPTNSSTTTNYYNRAFDSIIARYNPDTCRMYLTALSLGGSIGSRHISTMNNARNWTFPAVVLMSLGGTTNLDSVQQTNTYAQSGGHFYGMVGNNDSSDRPQTHLIYQYMQTVNQQSSKLYVYTHDGGGHGGWNVEYDTATRRDGENMYEWLGKHSKRPYAEAPANITTSATSITLNGKVNEYAGGWNGWNRTVSWTKLTGGSAIITNSSKDTTTVTGLSPGVYTFELKSVNAGGGLSATDTVTVAIQSPPPTASAGSDQNISTSTTTLTGGGTAGSGASITSYAWSKISGAGGTITSPSSATTSVTGLASGSYTFRLTVTQSDGQIDVDDVIVNVSIPSGGSFLKAVPKLSKPRLN